jgi:hypothetical protein
MVHSPQKINKNHIENRAMKSVRDRHIKVKGKGFGIAKKTGIWNGSWVHYKGRGNEYRSGE